VEFNLNLDVDFDQSLNGNAVARISVPIACSYVGGSGAPTLSEDCESYATFEREVARLKRELDGALEKVGERFGPSKAQVPAPSASPDVEGAGMSALVSEWRVADLMTRDVRTVGLMDELSVADELMKVGRFRHVVVVDDSSAVVGVVSHRDICFQALAWTAGLGRHAYDKLLQKLPARDMMASQVVTISPEASVSEAAGLMADRKIGCLPVVESARLVGILTEGDLLSRLSTPGPAPA
jgi:CBS domain-containing membrane protein